MPPLNDELVTYIQNSLLGWFEKHGRKLPWRMSTDPYAVLVVEKLLQQTSVRPDVLDAYNQILLKYPDPHALSQAVFTDLGELIEPLGFHYRAKEMVLMAKDIEEKFGGIVPNNLEALLTIFGVGDYSARAVLCFAFGKDVPVVDTNVARILYRVFGLPGKMPANPARKKSLIELMGSLIPSGNSKRFNWGMIDLGSMVCKSSKPDCENCPLALICEYYQSGLSIKQ